MKVTIFDPADCPEIKYLEDRFEFFRNEVYGQAFLDDIRKKFIVRPQKIEDFEKRLLAAAQRYERGMNINGEKEAPHIAISKATNLRNKLKSARDNYDKFINSPEMSVDELFYNLDCLYDQGKYKPFFDFLHDQRSHDGSHGYNLKSIFIFFDALIEAADSTLSSYEGEHLFKKWDPMTSWLADMERLFITYSDFSFTQGKYYTGIGYVSDCLEILYKLAKPLDKNITQQKIANKIKIYTASQNKK